ncbi:sulfur carrier protein ThiS [Catenovulum sp. 2E275]|uniref:sulfur carrier protein ThiS n=1 Tax=Catenovulum sp. 2E275 TaxID=2980497 RepID=UPI0021D3C713|nr:sulfur carrier protein ThiS [Catenovulum sp. 2E275]MCU4674999.1 sulfur carrier protein ThiS [Catenovulum sp. 2E275]
MKITVNGQAIELTQAQPLLKVVEDFGALAPFALAVNGQFVPKSQHQAFVLNEGDMIDILSPVQGG